MHVGRVEDGDKTPLRPQRPDLGPERPDLTAPRPPSVPPEAERYGREYYSLASDQRRAEPPKKLVRKRARSGWGALLWLLALIAGTVYLYLHPELTASTGDTVKSWILALRGKAFEGGAGYGDLTNGDEDAFLVRPSSSTNR